MQCVVERLRKGCRVEFDLFQHLHGIPLFMKQRFRNIQRRKDGKSGRRLIGQLIVQFRHHSIDMLGSAECELFIIDPQGILRAVDANSDTPLFHFRCHCHLCLLIWNRVIRTHFKWASTRSSNSAIWRSSASLSSAEKYKSSPGTSIDCRLPSFPVREASASSV